MLAAKESPNNPPDGGVHVPVLRKYPHWVAYLTAFVTLSSGVYSAIAFKWMNLHQAPKCSGCPDADFEGALLQCQLMFIGEALCLLIWAIDNWISTPRDRALLFDFITSPDEYTGPQECKWWFWVVCAIMDFTASLLINVALLITYASTVSMLRNLMVVTTACAQLVLVRKALRVHEWIGIALITIAMVLSAVPSLENPESSKYSTSQITVGIILCLVGTCVQSVQLLAEELAFRKGRYPPLKAVGVEGCAGLVYSFAAWAPYQAGGAENVTGSWYQQTHSTFLITIALVYIVGATVFNAAGLATTKLAGGLLRGIIFACRSPLVWLVSIAAGWQSYENWNLSSGIVFIIGFLVYINRVYFFQEASWFTKPIHCACTNPELDDEKQPGEHRGPTPPTVDAADLEDQGRS